MKDILLGISDDLSSIFSVSQIEIENGDPKIEVIIADGSKCERCWRKDISVVESELSICYRCVKSLEKINAT